MFGGAYIRREICASKSSRLILGKKSASKNRLGQFIVQGWKEIYVSNLLKGFTETRLGDVDLAKTQQYMHVRSLSIWTEEI